jgi:hypothetical protein
MQKAQSGANFSVYDLAKLLYIRLLRELHSTLILPRTPTPSAN